MGEEDFESLLEEHLTESDFEMYGEEAMDDEVHTSSSAKLDINNFTEDNIIGIGKFVHKYLGISGNASDLYHSGLKDMNDPFIQGISHDYVNKHPEYVLNGYILIVRDTRSHYGSYLNPIMINTYLKRNEAFKEYKEFVRNGCKSFQELGEYQSRYNSINSKITAINTMHMILYETHKLRKINQIEENEERGRK